MSTRRTRLLAFGCLALTTPATGLAAGYTLVVNGQVAPQGAIVVGGVTYVPLSALRLLGVNSSLKGSTLTLGATAAAAPITAPGGADQRLSVEGCIGEPLFNGVWRLTVDGVRPISRYNGQQTGYAVKLEWKNGTPKTIDANNTGFKSVTLAMADGNTLDTEQDQNLSLKRLPQATGLTLELPFYATSAATAAGLAQPSKLLIEIDPKVIGGISATEGLKYSVPNPSFRVRLDCQK